MSEIPPGWYKDPADPATQRWWDGEGWLGEPIPADAVPPPGPPAVPPPAPPAPVPTVPSGLPTAGVPGPTGAPPGTAAPPVEWPVSHRYPGVAPRPHGLQLATPSARFMARFVDVLAVAVLAAIANAWFAVEFWRQFKPLWNWAMTQPPDFSHVPPTAERAAELLILMCFVLTAVWFAYEVPGSANSGQTLGKRIMGIKVVRIEADERLGFGRAFWRWFRLAWPTPFWVACYGLPLILQFVDCIFVATDRRLHQALHDRRAATVVVQVPRPGRPEAARTPADTGWPGRPDATTRRVPETGDNDVDPR